MNSDQFALEPRDFPLCLASPQCPAPQQAACRTLFDHLAVRAQGDVAATAELLAVADSKAVVQRARPELAARIDALTDAHGKARAALHRLEVFLRSREIAAAHTAVRANDATYTRDGAYRRDRRLVPGRWTPDVLIAAAALFDVVFLGSLFRFLIDADPETRFGRIGIAIAYVPGFVLAAALMVTGLWLGRSVERHRNRADDREASGVPPSDWALPVGLALLTLTTVGVAAWARTRFLAEAGGAEEILPTWVVILLLVTVSITAIAAKIVGTNSHADHVHEAQERRKRADATGQERVAAAERAVVAHQQRWQQLRASVWVVVSDVEDLWKEVARHCGPPVIDADPRGRTNPQEYARLIRYTPNPQPAFGAVLDAVLTLKQYDPAAMESDLDRLRTRVGDQAAPPDAPA